MDRVIEMRYIELIVKLKSCEKKKFKGIRKTHLMMIAFSTEKESVGNPKIFHCRISTASPKVTAKLKSEEQVIWKFETKSVHSDICFARI